MSFPIIHLRDTNPALVYFWKRYFRNLPVEISQGNIFDMTADAIVSPANSFGIMSGGIDLLYTKEFGQSIERDVKTNIKQLFNGEMPVGQATVVPIVNSEFKYLISAPTMRVPWRVHNTVNAYLAFKAALLKARSLHQEGKVNTLLSPGLCTSTGQMCVESAARQMFVAYLNVALDKNLTNLDALQKQQFWMFTCSQPQDEEKAQETH